MTLPAPLPDRTASPARRDGGFAPGAGGPGAGGGLTTHDAVELFIQRTRHTRSGSAHTERAYRTDLRDLSAYLARRRLDLWTVSRAEANRYLAELAARAKPRTVKRRVSCVRSLYRFLRSIEAVDANPFDALDLPGHDPRSETHKVLSAEQAEAALAVLADDVDQARARLDAARLSLDRTRAFRRYFVAARRRAVAALALLGGLRTAEIVGLPVTAFLARPEGFSLSFVGKGGKRRTVPVAEELTPILVDWLTVRRQVPTSAATVFVTLEGRPVQANQVRREVQALGERIGTPFTLGPHALRRTFATRVLRATGDLRGTGDLLGHRTVATTEIYTHVDQEGLRALVEAARTQPASPSPATPPSPAALPLAA